LIGAVADDFTGAAEIGAVGLRHGLAAEVVVAGEPSGSADLVCIDTDSRSCDPTTAARRAAGAALLLRDRGATWIYKKTDSVLRGNVTPEIEAIVKQLGLSGALLVPGNPSLGRTIANGRYFVRGRPIHQTAFAQDPKHPRLSPNVLELIGEPSALPVFVRKPGESLPERGIVIGEAATSKDLHRWAALRNKPWLMAGAADFFDALLEPGTPVPETRPARGRQLFVCGSASEATRDFVAGQAERGVPVFFLPDKLTGEREFSAQEASALAEAVTASLQTNACAILCVGLPPVGDVLLAESLALHLVRVAEVVLRRTEVGQVFAEGGATAAALARRMCWKRLAVTAELAPGVVTMSVSAGDQRLLTIKPGSYAWPERLAR
jgi:D-threonate/D-erythronate kinase